MIEAEDVVVDDILLLESNERVPTDAVVLTENRLLVDALGMHLRARRRPRQAPSAR